MTIALDRNGTKRPSKAAEIEAVPTKNKPAAGAGAIAGAARERPSSLTRSGRVYPVVKPVVLHGSHQSPFGYRCIARVRIISRPGGLHGDRSRERASSKERQIASAS